MDPSNIRELSRAIANRLMKTYPDLKTEESRLWQLVAAEVIQFFGVTFGTDSRRTTETNKTNIPT